MLCSKCGNNISMDNNFCEKCGNKIIKDKKENKLMFFISLILQILAGLSYFAVFKSAVQIKYMGLTPLVVSVFFAIFFQILSTFLARKYPLEIEKAEKIVNTPKNLYGWIALGFFLFVVVIFLLYVYL